MSIGQVGILNYFSVTDVTRPLHQDSQEDKSAKHYFRRQTWQRSGGDHAAHCQ
jgi:hypothetical protein